MGRCILIRHARASRNASKRPAEWDLDPGCFGDIDIVADGLRGIGLLRLVTSTERKAVQTGLHLGNLLDIPVTSDERINEVARPWTGDDNVFTESAHAYLNGADLVGWESHAEVVQRMLRAVEDYSDDGLVGLVSHGTAISLLLDHLAPVRALDFWSALKTPDCWLVDAPTLQRVQATHDE